MFNEKKGIQLDTEIQRVIGNISHSIVMDEVQKYEMKCTPIFYTKCINFFFTVPVYGASGSATQCNFDYC